MKKLMKIFVLVAAAAMALASCQKPEIENVQPQEYEYTFLIGNADTKATVGETCVEWEAGDQMGVYTISTSGTSYNRCGNITPGSPATMVVSSYYALSAGDKVYAYYPYVYSNSQVADNVNLEIPAIQDGVDDMPMVSIPYAIPVDLAEKTDKELTAGEIKFANLGSVIEFNVYTETEAYAAEVVESVTFKADKALAGAFTFDLTKVNYSDESTLSISDLTETTVVANASDLAVGTKDAPAVVKMVVAPGTYEGSIIVKTNAATYTFPISSAKEFKRSAIKPLGLKLREDVREETKTVTFDFTSESELQNLGIDLPDAGKGTNISSMTLVKEEVSMTSTDGSTAATRIWNSSGSYDLRVYKNATMTFTVPTGCVITELTMSGDATSGISVSLLPANPVVLTVGPDASTQKVSTITVSYREGVAPEPEAKTLTGITISGQTTTYTVGDTFEFDGTVTATYSDNTTATVVPTSVSSPAMDAAGTFDVTVTYTEGEVTVTAQYQINISEADNTDYLGTYAILAYRNTSSEQMYYYLTNEETTTSTVRLNAIAAGKEKPADNVKLEATKLWQIEKSGSVYKIKSVDSGDYVNWTPGKNSANMYSDGIGFTMVKNDDGTCCFKFFDADEAKDRYFSLNSTIGSNYFAMYTSEQTRNLYLVPAVVGEEAKPTLTEISVSPKTTTYTVGDTFVFEGTVTATYSNGTTATVTPTSVSSPDMDAAGTFDVTVKYTEGEVTVEAKYQITINEKPAEGESDTVEMSTFTATSADMNAVISYTTAKGGGTANPAINGGVIRLYQNSAGTGGGTITITAKDGYKLSSVTIGSSMATKVAYTIGTSTTKSTSASVSANGKYTVDDINATSITFYCMGTSSSSRLYVNYLSATYVAD